MKRLCLLPAMALIVSCGSPPVSTPPATPAPVRKPVPELPALSEASASNFAQLTLKCVQKKYPNQPGLILNGPEDVLMSRALLRKRGDDVEEVIQERFREYREKTVPLIGYYRERGLLYQIDGHLPIEKVTSQMLIALGVNG